MTGEQTVQIPGQVVAVRVLGDGADPDADADAQRTMQGRASVEIQRNELRHAVQALRIAAQELDEARSRMVREVEEQLIDLAIDIARKVVMQEIDAGRARIDPIVAEALRHVPPRQEVVVHLNPEDSAQCEMAQETEDGGAAKNIRFVADPSVPRGGCVVETPEGTVNSSPQEHLEGIASALKSPE